MNIKIYRLLSGEIVMADELDEQGDIYNRRVLVRRPVCLVLDGDGVTMVLWLPYETSGAVAIFRRHIVAEATAARDLANEYCEKCGGIMTAGADALAALDAGHLDTRS